MKSSGSRQDGFVDELRDVVGAWAFRPRSFLPGIRAAPETNSRDCQESERRTENTQRAAEPLFPRVGGIGNRLDTGVMKLCKGYSDAHSYEYVLTIYNLPLRTHNYPNLLKLACTCDIF